MQNTELLRKIVANVARALSNEQYVDALVEGGLVAREGNFFYLGDNAADFCFNVYAEMAHELITKKGVPESFRTRLIKNMGDVAPLAFDKIYKTSHKLFAKDMGWCGPLVMVLFMAEPTRDPNLTLLQMCEIFEMFYEWKPTKDQKVLH